jgi:hypothetical protein
VTNTVHATCKSRMVHDANIVSNIPSVKTVQDVNKLISALPKLNISRRGRKKETIEKYKCDTDQINKLTSPTDLLPFLAKYYFYYQNALLSYTQLTQDVANLINYYTLRIKTHQAQKTSGSKQSHKHIINTISRSIHTMTKRLDDLHSVELHSSKLTLFAE